jgi:hypothetical protein
METAVTALYDALVQTIEALEDKCDGAVDAALEHDQNRGGL